MSIAEAFIGELKHECETTRRVLAAVPNTDLGWKPHPKSMSIGALAGHIAEVPGWVGVTVNAPELDMGTTDYTPKEPKNVAETLALFDKGTAEAIAALTGKPDADFLVPWSLKSGSKTYFTMPRVQVLRGFVLSHLIHHRGQMTVYLRLRNVPVPSVYGPSADFPEM